MSQALLAQIENRLHEIQANRTSLENDERGHSKAASEIRKEIIKLEGAEEHFIKLRSAVTSAMENGL